MLTTYDDFMKTACEFGVSLAMWGEIDEEYRNAIWEARDAGDEERVSSLERERQRIGSAFDDILEQHSRKILQDEVSIDYLEPDGTPITLP